MSGEPVCACRRVVFRPRERPGAYTTPSGAVLTTHTDHWVCDSCGAEFVRDRTHEEDRPWQSRTNH